VQELSGTTPIANRITGFGMDEFFSRTDSTGGITLLADALGNIATIRHCARALPVRELWQQVQMSLTFLKEQLSYQTNSGRMSTSPRNTPAAIIT